jgi:hypothetical protein
MLFAGDELQTNFLLRKNPVRILKAQNWLTPPKLGKSADVIN